MKPLDEKNQIDHPIIKTHEKLSDFTQSITLIIKLSLSP